MIEQDLLEGNKYFKWYWSICNKAKDRVISHDTYVEKHHIYPKSIYGQNKYLVKLTAKEHYIVHLLLWQGLKNKYGKSNIYARKMAGAFSMMNVNSPDHNGERYNCKIYSLLKESYNDMHIGKKGIKVSDETKKNAQIFMIDHWKNISDDDRNKRLNGITNYYKNLSKEEQINYILKLTSHRIGVTTTQETKDKISKSLTGKKQSVNTIEKRAKKLRGQKRTNEQCKKYSDSKIGNKNPALIKYIIKTPTGDIIELISRLEVRKFLKCSNSFFNKKFFNGYQLLGKIKIN